MAEGQDLSEWVKAKRDIHPKRKWKVVSGMQKETSILIPNNS